MKIGDFPLVETLVDTRARMLGWIEKGRLTIEIDGRHMGPDFVRALTPQINLEIRHRITEIDAQLRELGVVIE